MRKCWCCLFLLLSCCILSAEVKLPRLISDGMVLQRDVQVKLWGWADPGEDVSIAINNREFKAKADPEGNWVVLLPEFDAGGPYTMTITASNKIVINDILFGDVWVCSGQSNMELPMERVRPKFEADIQNSSNSMIRQFDVSLRYSFNTAYEDLNSGKWVSANPQTVLKFSAAAYFFANELYAKYRIPIGLIKSAVGGSPAEAWLSEERLKNYPDLLKVNRRYQDSQLVDSIIKADALVSKNWNDKIDSNDVGWTSSPRWYESNYDSGNWSSTSLPGYWADQNLFKDNISGVKSGYPNGAFWFRKTIHVPVSMTGKDALLVLGAIVDRDMVYVNGKFAGSTGYQYPPRRYVLPVGLLKEGENIITIRVISNSGKGGFVEGKEYALHAGNEKIDLTGDWQYKYGYFSNPMPQTGTTFQYQPGGLYNGMIAPLINYNIKGVIWYQGESNTSRSGEYQQIFTDLIRDWRSSWNNPELPFLYVQLASFMKAKDGPSESNWAELREAQRKTLALPNTGMAVVIDAGEWNDIHPLDKKTVGRRLALSAFKVAYHERRVIYSGPVYRSHQVKDGKVIVRFDNVGSGLKASGGDILHHFDIAGSDGKFIRANAEIIDKRKIVVWHDSISQPVKIRYAWADNPENANLINKENLPASPFEILVD